MSIKPQVHRRPIGVVAALSLLAVSALACSLTGQRAPSIPTFTPLPATPTITPTPTQAPTRSPTPTTIPPTRVPTAAEIIIVPTHRSEQGEAPKYTIQMDLPSMSSGDAAAGMFNDAVSRLAEDETTRFMADVAASESWRLANMPEVGSELSIQHSVRYNRAGLVSVQFTIFVYIVGAAHPSTYTHVINLDAQNPPSLLSLQVLFLPQSDYLQRIADHAVGELTSRDALQFPEGAAPTIDNYQNWVFDLQGLIIIFDAYQVAPYALGLQEITIPFIYLKPYMDPGGPFARVLE